MGCRSVSLKFNIIEPVHAAVIDVLSRVGSRMLIGRILSGADNFSTNRR